MVTPEDPAARARRILAERTSGFLATPIVAESETCAMCRTPIESQYTLCYRCNSHTGASLDNADRLGFVVYAVADQQSGHMMRTYKGRAGMPVSNDAQVNVHLTLWLGLQHMHCAVKLAGGLPITHWASVPSLPPRPDRPTHPLDNMLSQLFPVSPPKAALTAGTATNPRGFTHDSFTAAPLPRPAHVLLIDDTWVTGGHTLSAANALKRAGAEQVSALVVARWLDPRYGPTRDFLTRRKHDLVFRLDACPWTGAACP